jgi:predicted DCC family thiol-disulfide oxidoreductase YuxK
MEPGSFFYGGIIIPKKLRDVIYRIIAQNRYRLFGKQKSCRIPTPELKDRFL